MSFSMTSFSQNKENEPEESEKTHLASSQRDVLRLERLYSEQVITNQALNEEHERLQVELLEREKEIYRQQLKLKGLTELNKTLSKKLTTDTGYYEKELSNYKHLEKEWALKYNEFKNDKRKYEAERKEKDAEIGRLNNDLHEVLDDISVKNLEITMLREELDGLLTFNDISDHINEDGGNEYGKNEGLISQDDSEDELIDDSLIHTDSEYEKDPKESSSSFSLANELNDQLNDKEKTIKTYEFEIKSLQNEKRQLYDYINKLLKNRPHTKQNTILKKKLVDRKILRSISINTNSEIHSQVKKPRGKRIVSNDVPLKNYKFQTISTHQTNSDHESDELQNELLFMNRNMTSLGHRLLAFKESFFKVDRSRLLINPVLNPIREPNEEIIAYEQHELLQIE